MKAPLAVLAIVLLAVALAACGSSGGAGSSSSTARLSTASAHPDRDNDGDHNDDDDKVLNFGQAASASDTSQLVALVTAYLAAAAAENGAKACTLLLPFIAESVAENLSDGPGPHYTKCAPAIASVFAQHHRELAEKSATLKFYAVRVEGDRALTVLSFSAPGLPPEVRQLAERRDGAGAWRVLTLLDGIIE